MSQSRIHTTMRTSVHIRSPSVCTRYLTRMHRVQVPLCTPISAWDTAKALCEYQTSRTLRN
eukprot:1509314-Rhodomonas_salina.1